MFNFFSKKAEKKDLEVLKQAVQTGFNSVRDDFGKTSTWIKHLNTADGDLKDDVNDLQEEVNSLREELENVKNMVGIIGNQKVFKNYKQPQTVFNKQTPFEGVLNTVQTGVQTVFLDNLSTTERAIVFVLLNSDMKLSYADLAAMLGKRKATIRGQINTIKQKNDGLIEEFREVNGKKRLYIPENVRAMVIKSVKIKVKDSKSKK